MLPTSTVKRRLFALALPMALAALAGCEMVGYVARQSVGQISMLARREPIARVLQETDLPAQTRDRLVLVWYAREYAERVIGLRPSPSYHDVVRLDRDAASYVVAAAEPDSLEPYRWCFPVAGCLPYIGYFDRGDAVRERRRLAALGYDVMVRGVSGYSLGGWLPDPVYSPLLEDSRADVANTVIHELTHGTVFLPGRASFNEGLATFVGDHGMLAFLAERYGEGSATLAEARAELVDERTWDAHLARLITELRALYAQPLPRAEKLRRRNAVYAAAAARAAALPLTTARYRRAVLRPLNNAILATHATYHDAGADFEAVYQRLGRDLRRFVRFVHDDVARAPDPAVFITQWLARPAPAVPAQRVARPGGTTTGAGAGAPCGAGAGGGPPAPAPPGTLSPNSARCTSSPL